MLRSMTGFGRASLENEKFSFTVEIKSVNHRYFDLNIKIPKSIISLEDRIRKLVSEKIFRGKVDLYITQNKYDSGNISANFNKELGDSYVKCLKEIKDRYNLKDDISVSLIAKFPDVITINTEEEDIDEVWENLKFPLSEAVSTLVSMREKEGAKLYEDVLTRCKNVDKFVNEIKDIAPCVVGDYRNKLSERLKEISKDIKFDENRVASEIALFADKSNIDEEIVRLKSHVSQMMDTFSMDEPIGRKMDFIVQEMNREVNTIASKANNLEIVKLTLSLKNEIEKIREQIQNIE